MGFGLEESSMGVISFDDHLGSGEFDLESAGGLPDGVPLLTHEEDEFLSFLSRDRRYRQTDTSIATRFLARRCLSHHQKYNYLNV